MSGPSFYLLPVQNACIFSWPTFSEICCWAQQPNLSTMFLADLAFFEGNLLRLPAITTLLPVPNTASSGHMEDPCSSCTVSLCGVGGCHTFYRKSGGIRNVHHVCGGTIGTHSCGLSSPPLCPWHFHGVSANRAVIQDMNAE